MQVVLSMYSIHGFLSTRCLKGFLTSLGVDGVVGHSLSGQPLTGDGVVVGELGECESVKLGDQNSLVQGKNTVHHGVLCRHRDVLFASNRFDTGVKSNADQSIGGVGAQQRCRQEPQGWAVGVSRCVGNVQQTSIDAEQRVLELEELELAIGSDVAKGSGTASGITGKSEPNTTHGTGARDHSDGVVTDAWGNVHLLGRTAGGVDAHDRRVGVLGNVDQAGGRLLLDEHGAVEAWVEVVVGGVGDIGREDIVLASLLGRDLKTSPDTVANFKNTVRAISRNRDINRLDDGRLSREVVTRVDENELVVGLQRQPHLSGVHSRWPHAVKHGRVVFAHGECLEGNGFLGGCVELDLDQLAVRHLGQQHEIRVRHAGEFVRLSCNWHQILRDATAHKRSGGLLRRHAGSAERQRDHE